MLLVGTGVGDAAVHPASFRHLTICYFSLRKRFWLKSVWVVEKFKIFKLDQSDLLKLYPTSPPKILSPTEPSRKWPSGFWSSFTISESRIMFSAQPSLNQNYHVSFSGSFVGLSLGVKSYKKRATFLSRCKLTFTIKSTFASIIQCSTLTFISRCSTWYKNMLLRTLGNSFPSLSFFQLFKCWLKKI